MPELTVPALLAALWLLGAFVLGVVFGHVAHDATDP